MCRAHTAYSGHATTVKAVLIASDDQLVRKYNQPGDKVYHKPDLVASHSDAFKAL